MAKPSKPSVVDTDDSRFDAVRGDPRFQRFPKAKKHIEIDKRFQGMLLCTSHRDMSCQLLCDALPP